MIERVVQFGSDTTLTGILTQPEGTSVTGDAPTVLLLNTGIVHRSGPHRFNVLIARELAQQGYAALRFDFAGIGDSTARSKYVSPQTAYVLETREAMDFLSRETGARHFILMGICYGAIVAFETALCDERVVGNIQVNPQGFLFYAGGTAQYRSRIGEVGRLKSSAVNLRKWTKLLTGRIPIRRLWGVVTGAMRGPLAGADQQAAVRIRNGFNSLRLRRSRSLVIFSEQDPGVRELEAILGARLAPGCQRHGVDWALVGGADHLFTLLRHQDELLDHVQPWVGHWESCAAPLETSTSLTRADN